MQFLLLLYTEEGGWARLTDAEQQQWLAAYAGYVEALGQTGALRSMGRLQASAEAITVRVEAGQPRAIDGPFAETKEQLGGYFLIDVANRDEAMAWAGRCPAARHGAVEVRAIQSAGDESTP